MRSGLLFSLGIWIVMLMMTDPAHSQQRCKGTKKWYAGSCRYPEEIEKMKQQAEKAAQERESKKRALEEMAKKKAEEAKRKSEEEAAKIKAEAEAVKKYLERESLIESEGVETEAAKDLMEAIQWQTFYPMVLIIGGCYTMGCISDDANCGEDEKPPHKACVHDFFIGKTEVTVSQYRRFVEETGYQTEVEEYGSCFVLEDEWHKKAGISWRDPGYYQKDDYPVVCVTWNDAWAFAKWMSRKSGRTYRLPYEAEWEYVAQNKGQKRRFPWGDAMINCDLAVFKETASGCGLDSPWPVCSKSKGNTASSLCDMSGNVWEWCEDIYSDKYYFSSPFDNPKGPASGEYRVIRGGSWQSAGRLLRTTQREWFQYKFGNYSIGFRLVRETP